MSKPDVLMLGPLMPPAAQAIEEHFNAHRLFEAGDKQALLAALAPRVRGISGGGHGRIDRAFIDALPSLEIIANFGVGYDYVDAVYAGEKGIIVTNTPDVLNEEVADLTLALLLATVRELPQADRHVRAGHWPAASYALTATLRGRVIGILGLGRIGKAIARRCEGFGLRVVYHGRRQQDGIALPYYADLRAMAHDVDVLIVVAPGGAETSRIVDAEVLRALGPQGILINVARGSLVDEAALIEALRAKTIFAAGLDVFAAEPNVPAALIAMDNVVLLPHVGSGSVATRNAMAQLVADNLISWFAGKGALTPVPETPWPR